MVGHAEADDVPADFRGQAVEETRGVAGTGGVGPNSLPCRPHFSKH